MEKALASVIFAIALAVAGGYGKIIGAFAGAIMLLGGMVIMGECIYARWKNKKRALPRLCKPWL